MGIPEKLANEVFAKSESRSWRSCVIEWEIAYCDEDDEAGGTCVCGQEGLRYMYAIRNTLNGNVIYPIGSECIKRFESNGLNDEAHCWAKAYKLVALASKYGKSRRISIYYDKSMFSRKLLAFMYRHGVFKATEWNEWDGGNDYVFMLDMFNSQSMTSRQMKKADHVMRESVYPWLGKLYKNKNERRKQYGLQE